MLQTLIIHNNVFIFYVTFNVYKTAGLLPFVDEVRRKLVTPVLCCWYKDHANLQVSVITRMGF
jgi:hypothetical protein